MMNATTLRNFTYPLEAMSLLRLARFTLLPILALSGLALGMGTARAGDLLITNGTSSNFSSGNNSYGAISVGTSEGVVDGNNLTVVNTNTVVASTGDLTVGGTGSGNSLVISNGGTVAADNSLNLGHSAGSDSNSIVVTGTGSSLAVGNAFIGTADGVGNTGNTLEVSAGGSFTSGNAFFSGLSNSVLVTGSGSTWTNSGQMIVGIGGDFGGSSSTGNSLVIANGGKVASAAVFNNLEFMIGLSAGDNQNSVTVTGAGSLLTNGGDVIVGYYGSSNSLVVSGGGMVANASGFVGFGGTDNTALVTGAGSLWTNSGTLTVGGSPFSGAAGGTLTVASGGTVAAAGGITIAAQAGDTGTLNIGRFGTNDAAGTIITPTIAFGAGTGAINFNQSNSTTVSAAISGNGSVNQLGTGTTILSGANTYTGLTKVSGGTLAVNGSIAGDLQVDADATLKGSGRIAGATTISGTHEVGNSPGIQSFGSSLSYKNASTVLLEFTQNSTAGRGVYFDGIDVAGDLSFDPGAVMSLTFNSAGSFVNWNDQLWNNYVKTSDGWLLYSVVGSISGLNDLTISSPFLDSNGLALSSARPNSYFNLYQVGNNVYLNYAVPEPSTYALLGLGALALLIAYRRKSRKDA